MDAGAPFWAERPDLDACSISFWDTYWVLAPSRQISANGAGYIPLSEIVAYCEIVNEDDPEDRLWLVNVVHRMDETFLAYAREQNAEVSGPRTEG